MVSFFLQFWRFRLLIPISKFVFFHAIIPNIVRCVKMLLNALISFEKSIAIQEVANRLPIWDLGSLKIPLMVCCPILPDTFPFLSKQFLVNAKNPQIYPFLSAFFKRNCEFHHLIRWWIVIHVKCQSGKWSEFQKIV